MDQFACYYCAISGDSFADIIGDSIVEHNDKILKIKSRELNISSGNLGYRTHNFLVNPRSIQEKKQNIIVKNAAPGNLQVQIVGNIGPRQVATIRSPLAKKSKRNHVSSTDTGCESLPVDMDIDEQSKDEDTQTGDVKRLTEHRPSVIHALRRHGQLELWKKVHELIANNKFPMDNIAFLLFLDVVRWYSKDNTVAMRYDDSVSKFWRIGFKSIHGRFLRFLRGPKHNGQIVFQESQTSYF